MKITVHPLFLALVVASAFFKALPQVLIFALTALIHECGHIFCASNMGYEFQKIKLMPYGASAVCDIDGISTLDEVKLALSGPLVNLIICAILGGLWWFFPQSYAFTDTLMLANGAMLAINLLPAYPLDGGRVLHALLSLAVPEKWTRVAFVAINAVLAVALVVLALVYKNATIAIFALFLVCSIFEKPNKAVLINFSSSKKLKRGMEVKYVLVDENITFKDAVKLLDGKKYLVLQLYDNGVVDEITQDELYEKMTVNGIYDGVFAQRSKKLLQNSSLDIFPSSTFSTTETPNVTPSSIASCNEE